MDSIIKSVGLATTYIAGCRVNFMKREWNTRGETTLVISPFKFDGYTSLVADSIIMSPLSHDNNDGRVYTTDYSTALGLLATNANSVFTRFVIFYSKRRMTDIHIIWTWFIEHNRLLLSSYERLNLLTMMVPVPYAARLFDGDMLKVIRRDDQEVVERVKFFEPNNDWSITQTIDAILRWRRSIGGSFSDRQGSNGRDGDLFVYIVLPIYMNIDEKSLMRWRRGGMQMEPIRESEFCLDMTQRPDLVIDFRYESKQDVISRVATVCSPVNDYVLICSREWWTLNVPNSPVPRRYIPTCIDAAIANLNGYNFMSEKYNNRMKISDDLLKQVNNLIRRRCRPVTALLVCYLNQSGDATDVSLYLIALIEIIRELDPSVVFPLYAHHGHDNWIKDIDNQWSSGSGRLVTWLNDIAMDNAFDDDVGSTTLVYPRVEYDNIESLTILIDGVSNDILKRVQRRYNKLCGLFDIIPLPQEQLTAGTSSILTDMTDTVRDAYRVWSKCLGFKNVNTYPSNRLNTLKDDTSLIDISAGGELWWCITASRQESSLPQRDVTATPR